MSMDMSKNPSKANGNARARICKRFRSPGIDAEESIPTVYVAWRVGTTNRVVVPARQAGSRFLGSLKSSTNMGSGQLKCLLCDNHR